MATEIQEIKAMLQKHADDSNRFREKMLVDMAVVKTNVEVAATTINKHDDQIEKLNDRAKESSIVVKILSAIGLLGVEEFFRHNFFK